MMSTTAKSVIIGELNAQSRLLDYEQPPDSCGQEIKDWLIEKDLFLLNNRSSTIHSRIYNKNKNKKNI